jgi:uncharacterized protein (TIGR02246 family)
MTDLRPGSGADHELPRDPDDLGRLFLQRANAGDVDGVVALYEPGAVLAGPSGQLTTGSAAIRAVYQQLLADRPAFTGDVQPAIRLGDLALTSTRFDITTTAGGRTTTTRTATTEIARRQPDGTWLWAVDQPNVLAP